MLLGRDKPTVPPKTWAKAVCTALTPWRTRVADLTAAAQQEITGTGTPAETKRTLTTLLAGAEEASERARTRVADAGVPDVDQGAAVARQFATALTSARDAYGHAKTAVGQLPTVEAATFYDGVSAAFVTLNEEYGASELDISAVGPEPLRRSFDEVPECQ
ncbi:MAG: hypothetical protein HKP61_19220 [Dactylosporangium sp.]|nr:hypothetical protein [Dactylosporangium sp.]NNJ63021.1 hypothetical protein [Dactylosporangium sp.]